MERYPTVPYIHTPNRSSRPTPPRGTHRDTLLTFADLVDRRGRAERLYVTGPELFPATYASGPPNTICSPLRTRYLLLRASYHPS